MEVIMLNRQVFSTAASLTLSFSYASAVGLLLSEPAAAQSTGRPVVYLDQGWSQADREMYYQTPQGSSVIDYDIFLHLEVAGSQELFRSDVNSDRFGLTLQAANPRTNPDGLPIGLSKTVTK